MDSVLSAVDEILNFAPPPPIAGNSSSHLNNAPRAQASGLQVGSSIGVSRSIATTATDLGKSKKKPQPPHVRSLTERHDAAITSEITYNVGQNLINQVVSSVRLLPDNTHDIAREMTVYSNLSSPSPSVMEARRNVINTISRAINQSPKTRDDFYFWVVPFGSTKFGLDSDASDLDLCILDPYLPHGPLNSFDAHRPRRIYNMRTLGQILTEVGFKGVCPVPSANVPIVKLRSPGSSSINSIAADLNCNSILGCRNSELIKTYHELSPTVFRPLGMTIKLWAKARGICDPAGNYGPPSASSYTLILMLIAYLQSIGHLPNLQDENYINLSFGQNRDLVSAPARRLHRRGRKGGPPPVDIIQHDTTFVTNPAAFSWKPKPVESLSAIFIGFFQYYDQFHFSRQVISVRMGQPLDRRAPRSLSSGDAPITTASDVSTLDDADWERVQADPTESTTSDQSEKGQVENSKRGSRISSSPIPPDAPPCYGWDEPIAVEDPFIRTRNTSKNIGRETALRITSEFKRARHVLERGGGLAELCEWVDPPHRPPVSSQRRSQVSQPKKSQSVAERGVLDPHLRSNNATTPLIARASETNTLKEAIKRTRERTAGTVFASDPIPESSKKSQSVAERGVLDPHLRSNHATTPLIARASGTNTLKEAIKRTRERTKGTVFASDPITESSKGKRDQPDMQHTRVVVEQKPTPTPVFDDTHPRSEKDPLRRVVQGSSNAVAPNGGTTSISEPSKSKSRDATDRPGAIAPVPAGKDPSGVSSNKSQAQKPSRKARQRLRAQAQAQALNSVPVPGWPSKESGSKTQSKSKKKAGGQTTAQ